MINTITHRGQSNLRGWGGIIIMRVLFERALIPQTHLNMERWRRCTAVLLFGRFWGIPIIRFLADGCFMLVDCVFVYHAAQHIIFWARRSLLGAFWSRQTVASPWFHVPVCRLNDKSFFFPAPYRHGMVVHGHCVDCVSWVRQWLRRLPQQVITGGTGGL